MKTAIDTVNNQGTAVEVLDFRVRWAYMNYLAGSHDRVSRCVRETLKKDIADWMWDCGAVHIIDDGRTVLPSFICMAYLRSAENNGGEGDFRQLMLCWFIEESDRPISELVDDARTH
jgi:hypothetical protein